MARAVALQVTVGLLLLTSFAPIVQGASVEGFLETGMPVAVEGATRALLQDPTILIQNPQLATPEAPLVLRAASGTLTRHVLEERSVQLLDDSLSLPGRDYVEEVLELEDATIELSALTASSDILLAPRADHPLVAGIRGTAVSGGIVVALDGVRVLDGFRKTWGEEKLPGRAEFVFEYERPGPLVQAMGVGGISIEGGLTGYVWGTHVLVQNATQIMGSYQTGLLFQSGPTGLDRTEHYEYVTFELEGVQALLEPGDVLASTYGQALALGLDGTARLPAASGSFSAGRDFYRVAGDRELVLQGNLTLAITPLGVSERGAGTPPALATVHVTGELAAVSQAPLPRPEGRSTTTIVAYGAGGATVVGVAAWYILASTGLVAVPLARRRTSTTAVLVQNPGELLFDTDRFTLYHVVRRHAGLSAAEARALTGIEDAPRQLDALAEGGLLVPMADEPRRYAVPGLVSERRAQRIATLRDPAVLRVVRLLALHGLTPESVLFERAGRAAEPVRARQVAAMLPRLEQLGLVRREPGEGGRVADPTDELFVCLKLMGEFAEV